MIGKIIAFLFFISFILGVFQLDGQGVSAAIMEGATSAVTLIVSICGGLCLWSGLSEIMEQSGFAQMVSAPFRGIVRLIFGKTAKDRPFMAAMSQNMTANFLGLGNLATPMGLEAAGRLQKIGTTNQVIRLIVLNTASIQLVPASLAAIRGSLGAAAPFDIMPAVIISSTLSVICGVGLCLFMEKRGGDE